MQSYVIHIERATERRFSILQQSEKYSIDYEIFRGIDWLEIDEEIISQNVHPKFLKKSKKFHQPDIRGPLACWLSHRDVWDLALRSNEEVIAVFEDDAGFTSDTKAAIEALDEFSRTKGGGIRYCISL